MGFFEKIFPKKNVTVKDSGYFSTLASYAPAFRSWDGSLYESELVRAAIDARSRHISKLSVQIYGSAQPKLQTRLRLAPNRWTTWSQFMYRVNTILDMKNNAYIVPVYDQFMVITGITVLCPTETTLVTVNDEPWLRFKFANGGTAAEELSRVGILTKYQYESEIFGSNNDALNDTMALIAIQNQGIEEASKNSATYKFMAQVNNFATDEDLQAHRKKFSETNFESKDGGGILLFPNTFTNIQQVKQQSYAVNPTERELIQKNVFNYFGVNDKILQNSALGDDLDAFFNGAIEPFAIQFSEVLTKMLFTDSEQAHGAKVVANANRLQYMATSEKISMSQQLGDRGAILIDEIRDLFNYPPLPDGAGQHAPIRGEYYMVDEGKNKPEESENNDESE